MDLNQTWITLTVQEHSTSSWGQTHCNIQGVQSKDI